jgi:hypothetical protein
VSVADTHDASRRSRRARPGEQSVNDVSGAVAPVPGSGCNEQVACARRAFSSAPSFRSSPPRK